MAIDLDPITAIHNAIAGIGGDVGATLDDVKGVIDDANRGYLTPAEYAKAHPSAGSTPAATTTTKKKAAALPSPTTAAKGEPTTTESPYETLANSLAQQYITQQNQLQPLIEGGQMGAPASPSAQLSTALAGTGASVPASATKVEGEVDPTSGALASTLGQEANINAEGDTQMAQDIAATGKANTETLEAAPWQQLLSELASETAYKAATQGASAFGLTAQNTPAFLAPILQNLGLSASDATGLTAPGTKAPTSPTKAATSSSTNPGTETSNPADPAS